ncbi:MAG: DNA polymerase III subunit alpha, partial [Gammaproteobacteria bacterium]
AFDTFNDNRASHMAELPTAIKVAEHHVKMAAVGQNDLFGLAVNAESSDDEIKDYADKVPVWPEKERLAFEKLALGLFLTGHPIDQYWPELKNIVHGSIAKTLANAEKIRGNLDVRLAGLLIGIRTRQDRKGRNMGFATLDDKSARVDVAIYSDTFENYKDLLKADEVLVVEGSARIDGYSGNLSITAEKLYSMEQARESFARCLMLDWDSTDDTENTQKFVHRLQETLQPFSGGQCMLVVNYLSDTARTSVQLGDAWRIHPTDELILRLQRILKQDEAIQIKYR